MVFDEASWHDMVEDKAAAFRARNERKPNGKTAPPPNWWRDGAITAAQLQHMQFPALRFVVPDLIPEGLTLLAGKPKVGKSWMMLDLAIAVTSNRFTLGEIRPTQGDVLYLALEDSKRRLQRRLTKLLPTFIERWPERLTLKTEWMRVDEGGIDGIRDWYKSVKEPTLVIVDTLEKIRPKPRLNQKAPAPYSLDYEALEGLQHLASECAIANIVTTHVRKAEADDVFDTISGTLGLTAAADTIAVLGQLHGSPTLCVRGRDIEDVEQAMRFDRASCRWTILGAAEDVARSDNRTKILTTLRMASEVMRPADVVLATGLSRQNVDKTLFRMAEEGEITKIRRGLYVHPTRLDLIPINNRPKRPMSD